MSQSQEKSTQVVYVVSCYGNLLGVYANAEDAWQVANQRIQKGHPADVLSRQIF